MRHPIPHLHPVRKCHHVVSFIGCQGQCIFSECVRDLLQGKAQLSDVNELRDQPDVLVGKAIVHPDQESTKDASDLFVLSEVHGDIVSVARGTLLP